MNHEPIRILRLIARLNVGGPAIHTTLLTHYLKERGYDPRLVAGREEAREGNMLYIAREKGVEPILIPELSREIRPWRDWISYRKISRIIREFRPHIVHTHTAKAGALGRLAARKYNVPVVVHTFHGHVLKGEFGPVKSEIFRRIEKKLARFTDKLIFISDTGRDELVQMGVAPADKFEVIHLGLELEKFRHAKERRGLIRREIGLEEHQFLAGMVARLAGIKNHFEFLEAIRRVLQVEPDLHFAIVGDGPARDGIVSKARELGVESRVHFLGMRDDMVQVHADLDLVVLTSKNEGLPVAFLEAMSSGTPIVGSDVGATRELQGPDFPGRLYQLGDVNGVVEAILDVYQKRSEFELKAQRFRDYIIKEFSIERLVGDLDRLYRKLLADKGLKF